MNSKLNYEELYKICELYKECLKCANLGSCSFCKYYKWCFDNITDKMPIELDEKELLNLLNKIDE